VRLLIGEDEEGVVETTLFPEAYRRWGHLLKDVGPFIVERTVERHHGVATLTIERLAWVGSAGRGHRGAPVPEVHLEPRTRASDVST
jgi:hypothetical protein